MQTIVLVVYISTVIKRLFSTFKYTVSVIVTVTVGYDTNKLIYYCI